MNKMDVGFDAAGGWGKYPSDESAMWSEPGSQEGGAQFPKVKLVLRLERGRFSLGSQYLVQF